MSVVLRQRDSKKTNRITLYLDIYKGTTLGGKFGETDHLNSV
jgi:hypothetical protein